MVNISDIYNCIFIHIPRTGGSSIKKALNLPGRGHPTCSFYKKKYPDKWHSYVKFAVSRNPWDRAVSAYSYARMWKSYWHNNRMGPHPDYRLLYDKTFEQCCEILKHKREKLQHESWHPQIYWILTEENSDNLDKIDLILRYDNLENDFSHLCGLLGIEGVKLPNVNKSLRQKYRGYYNQETRNIIADIYFNDIELYKYRF